MTINKAQSKSLKLAGLKLRSPSFSYNQLYVNCLRVCSPKNPFIIAPKGKWPSWWGLQNTPTASVPKGNPPSNECPGYDTKQSDGEASVMLELLGMRSTPSLPLLPGLLKPREVAPDRVLSIGQIELFLHSSYELMLNWIVWNRTVFIFNSM